MSYRKPNPPDADGTKRYRQVTDLLRTTDATRRTFDTSSASY